MKNPRFRYYIYWGVTALAVLAVSVAVVFFFLKFRLVAQVAGEIARILSPITYGAVLAYLLLPIYNRTRRFLEEKLERRIKSAAAVRRLSKTAATLVSLIVLAAIVVGLCSMLLPQLYESLLTLQSTIGGSLNNLSLWLQGILKDNEDLAELVLPMYKQFTDWLQGWMYTDLVPHMSRIIGGVSNGLLGVVNVLKNLLVGVIVMVYLLNIKDVFSAQAKKIAYGLLPVKAANRLIDEVRFIHKVFGGFITGKLLDSLIIGILCFFGVKLLDMPYVLLISVIIGVTNVIPFFGPFIGAIPSAFLILLVSPVKCLYFLLFVLLLQQFDGNILGPKILGDSTGLPSFWVLFSILLFGGLFGFVGMIIAVPTFAVFYRLLSDYVNLNLRKKDMSTVTGDYLELDHVDEEKGEFISRRP